MGPAGRRATPLPPSAVAAAAAARALAARLADTHLSRFEA
jgi:hypothetical protein